MLEKNEGFEILKVVREWVWSGVINREEKRSSRILNSPCQESESLGYIE